MVEEKNFTIPDPTTANTSSKKKMRILVSRFSTPMFVNAVRELRARGFDIVYWDRANSNAAEKKDPVDELLKKEFPHTIFHTGADAMQGIPAKGVTIAQFPPVGRDILQALYPCESQVLTMMKTEDPDNVIPVFKKKHLYYTYVKYWYGVLTGFSIDAVISANIPHMSFQYVIYALTRLLGIRFIMMRETIGARYIVTDSIEEYMGLKHAYDTYRGRNFCIDDLSHDLRAYYRNQILPDSTPTPHFMDAKRKIARVGDFRWSSPTIGSLVRNVKKMTLHKAAYTYIKLFAQFLFSRHQIGELEPRWHSGFALQRKARQWSRIKSEFRSSYMRLQSEPDISLPFVYVPLHAQPECNTSAMGGVFVDQLLMVDILSASLPEGWLLYVKENPGQWRGPRMHAGRFNNYYDEIAAMKNVRFIDPNFSTFNLIKHSQAVASVVGTACWEAVLRGKPSLVFGYVWYMYCDGVFRVYDEKTCRDAFMEIKNGYAPDAQKVLNYLGAFDRVTFVGFHSKRWKKGLGITLSEEENTRAITDAFYKELTKPPLA